MPIAFANRSPIQFGSIRHLGHLHLVFGISYWTWKEFHNRKRQNATQIIWLPLNNDHWIPGGFVERAIQLKTLNLHSVDATFANRWCLLSETNAKQSWCCLTCCVEWHIWIETFCRMENICKHERLRFTSDNVRWIEYQKALDLGC